MDRNRDRGRYRDRNSYRGKRTEGRGQRDRYKYSRTEVKALGQVDMDRDGDKGQR